jgi:hypothetical protein
MLERVADIGMNLWHISPGFVSQSNGRVLQVDCLFVRENSLKNIHKVGV